MSLLEIGEGVFVVPGRTCLGVLAEGDEAVLVDTGSGVDSAKRALKVIESAGLCLKGIVNTHAHADHYGGNAYLARKRDLRVYASAIEATVLAHPILEPTCRFYGVHPPRNLRNRFLMGSPSPVDGVLSPGPHVVSNTRFEVVALPGHTLGHVGVARNGVLFAGDAFLGEETLRKNPIPYNVDTRRALESIEFLIESDYDTVVPSHTEPLEEHGKTIALNRERILEVARLVLEEVGRAPTSTGRFLKVACGAYGVSLEGPTQYYLMKSAVASVLSYLRDEGRLYMACEGGEMLWFLGNART